MNFSQVVNHIARTNDLKRIARARLFDTTRLDADQLREGLIDKVRHYTEPSEIYKSVQSAILNEDRDVRTITPIFLSEVLLQQHGCTLTQKQTEEAVIDWEQSVIDESKNSGSEHRKIHNFEFFKFVLEAAWENNNTVSRDEKNLIEKIRSKLKITEKEYRIVEAQLKQFPKEGNELHQREEINKVRNYLQEAGLLLTYRNSDNEDCDVIPEEMVAGMRASFGLEIRIYGYRQLIRYKAVRKNEYLKNTLSKSKIALVGNPKLPELQDLCVEHVSPQILLGGISPKDGLEKTTLEKWCKDIAAQISGTKEELISRIISHYDGLIERQAEIADEREEWFRYYEQFANRDRTFLRAQHLADKDLEMEAKFEKATAYLFEIILGHRPLPLPGSEQPDGSLAVGDGLLLWDNKSKETQCNLKDHLSQFDRYYAARKGVERVYSLLVIAPDFTPESHQTAQLHEVQSGNKLTLITAKELKSIAVRWSASDSKDDPFPLKYFTMTGRFNTDILSSIL